jgi:hypothetical protein
LTRRDRQILVRKGVALRHEYGRARVVDILAHDAMGKEPMVEGEQDDIRDANVFDGTALENQHVMRPDRREHTRAGHLDPCGAKAPQRVGNERRHGRRQELFLTALHGPLVGLIFPHASAIVSKTCSRTNAGFS